MAKGSISLCYVIHLGYDDGCGSTDYITADLPGHGTASTMALRSKLVRWSYKERMAYADSSQEKEQ